MDGEEAVALAAEDDDGDSEAAANRGLLRMGCCDVYMNFFNCKRPSNVAGFVEPMPSAVSGSSSPGSMLISLNPQPGVSCVNVCKLSSLVCSI